MIEVNVKHQGAVKFQVSAGSHTLICDQPACNGGSDEGMTPPELFLSGLAACAAFYAVAYLKKKGLDREGVTVLVNPGWTNQQFVAATIANARVVVVPDNRAIPTMVADGRGDVMFTDGVEARLKAARDRRLYAVDPDHPFTHSEHVYFLPKGQTALLTFVNAWVDKSKADGTYAKLFAKYVGS